MARARRVAIAALVFVVSLGSVAVGAVSDSRSADVARVASAVRVVPAPLAAVPWPPSGSILVAEVVTGGASASDEYVELTNAGPGPVDLAGLELAYVTASGSTVTRKATWPTTLALDPGRHLLVANAAGAFAGLADSTYSGGLAATGGALVIRPIGGTAIDAVGWGDATNAFVEGSPAAAPPAGSSIERLPAGPGGNGRDTNDNATDWIVQAAPQPQGLDAPPVPSATPTPTPTAAATPTPTSTPTPTPTPAPTPTPTPAPTPTPTPSAAPTPTAAATPTSTPTPTPTSTPTPTPTPTPTATPTAIGVATARGLPDGSTATVEGVVTVGIGALESGRSGFLQDVTGGIAVYLDTPLADPIRSGTRIRVTGSLDDRYAQRTLRVAIGDMVEVGGAPFPDPIATLSGSVGEPLEGLRVAIDGTVAEAPTGYADGLGVLVDDGSGPVRAIVGAAALADLVLQSGDRVALVGVVGQRDSSGAGDAGYRLSVTNPGELVVRPGPTPTPVAPPTPEPSATAGPTGSPAPTAGVSPSPAPTATPSPTASANPTPSASPTPTVTPSPTPAPSSPPISTIRTLPVGAQVTVGGVVTAEAGRLGSAALCALGDASGGIIVRLPSGATGPARGARLLVVGVLAEPYGQLEIRTSVGGIVPEAASAALPSSLAIGAGDLDETTEGRLASLTGTIEHAPSRTSDGLAAWLVDDAGDRARILVATPSGIAPADLQAGHRYRLTGIVGQRSSRKGALDGYRLWLRDRADVVHLAAPSPTPSPTPSPGSSSGSPETVTIARALALQGRTVSVVGVVTIPSTLLDATGRRIVIQDATAAIEVRLPSGRAASSPGRRIRVTGEVGRAYDAPRIRATEVADLGSAALPTPRTLTSSPTIAVEWRLVRVSGTVVDVKKLGDRWRAEMRVGSARVAISGLPGARIASTTLVEGRRATVVGIARRAYPGAADRRFSVVPRSPADVSVSDAGGTGGGGSGAGGAGSAGTSLAPDGQLGEDPAADGAPLVELGSLDAHLGQRVHVGGLVVELVADGFSLDDGTATGRIHLVDEAAAYLGLIEPGDPIEVSGTVEASGDGTLALVVAAAADVARVGDPGSAAGPSDPALVREGGESSPSVDRAGETALARTAGLDGLPGLTVAGVGWLAGMVGLSLAVTLVRRRRARRALGRRIAARLADLAGPRAVP